ncbi:hypothetical protein LEN26_008801 [Aphanomyces euteiches]|nr:hypothetical protein LEN26_008801 [Aphanomyces euteiches]
MPQMWSQLPFEVIVKIAFSIEDAEDHHTFLKTIQDEIDLGPLEHLFELGKVESKWDFWPSVCLVPPILQALPSKSLGAIAKYYPKVVVEDNFDVDWVKENLDPMTKIEWRIKESSITADDWAGLRITQVCVCSRNFTRISWKDLLSQLPHLTYLEVDVLYKIISDVFEFVAMSNQITELLANTMKYKMTTSDVIHLTEWFRNQPVRRLELALLDMGDVDMDVKKAFCEVMLQCRTLETLVLSNKGFTDLRFTKLPLSLKTLVLNFEDMTSGVVKSLAYGLEGSGVNRLRIVHFGDGKNEGLEYLLRVLPLTCIKDLELRSLQIEDTTWCKLAPLFESCPVPILTLYSEKIPTGFAQAFATALEKNQFICELDLDHSDIGISDLKQLIRSFSNSSRPVKTKRFKVKGPNSRSILDDEEESLKKLAAECGVEFMSRY